MVAVYSRRHWLGLLASMALTVSVQSCGTLLYPERRGQPAGRLDWGVVLMNSIGLLFFFIPGVIAFAVDFINGTIYLPPDYSTAQPIPAQPISSKNGRLKLRKVKAERSDLTRAGLEAFIQRETAICISLSDNSCITSRMQDIDEFWSTQEALTAGHTLDFSFSDKT